MSASDPSAASLRELRAPLSFGFFNSTTWMIALGTPMILLAGRLGATAFEVGLAYSFVFILLPVQVLATAGLPYLGYKRQMLIAWSARVLFLLIPFALALHAPAEPTRWMVWALVGSVFGFTFVRALGSCAVMPWLYTLVPESLRGRYFATEQFLSGLSVILTLLFCAAVFRIFAVYTAFQIQYGYAIAGGIISAWFIGRMRDVPAPERTTVRAIARRAPSLCLAPGGYRRYLVFMIAANVMTTAFSPFIAYFLTVNRGLESSVILLYVAGQYVGGITGAWILRGWIDRIEARGAFRVSQAGNIATLLFWLAFVAGAEALLPFLPVGYFLFGLSMAFFTAGHLYYLPTVCPENERALTISVHSAVVGLVGGMAPILWGWFLKESGDLAGMDTFRFALYLGLAAGAQALLFIAVSRLESVHPQAAPVRIGTTVLRPFRYIAQLVQAVETTAANPSPGKEGASPTQPPSTRT